jgi:hypothetical protein
MKSISIVECWIDGAVTCTKAAYFDLALTTRIALPCLRHVEPLQYNKYDSSVFLVKRRFPNSDCQSSTAGRCVARGSDVRVG